MDGCPVDGHDSDPLAHLPLTCMLAIWARLSEPQQAACARYRGVGVGDLEVLHRLNFVTLTPNEVVTP